MKLNQILPIPFLLGCLAIPTLSLADVIANDVWIEGNSHHYIFVRLQGASWQEAETDLENLLPGFHLATITSQEEQDFVTEVMTNTGLSFQFWIDRYQDIPKPEADPSAGWNWVTGEPWSYTNWNSIEPNNAGGFEDHLAMDGFRGWNDEGSAVAAVYGYIAESIDPMQKSVEAGFVVTFESGSVPYPTGTTKAGDDGPVISMTDDPLGPFSGQSVHFRGTALGGKDQVYRYRLDFDQEVQLSSVVVSGTAWLGSLISLLDANESELVTVNVTTPGQGSNSFQDVELDASCIVGNTFYLEEFNSDQDWRYRINIEVNVDLDDDCLYSSSILRMLPAILESREN